jgi:hypothetical protein
MRRHLEMPEVLSEPPASADPATGAMQQATPRPRKWLLSWWTLPWFALAALIAILIVVFATVRQDIPLLTPDELQKAQARWQALQIRDYDMKLLTRLDGLGSSQVHVAVRDGRVTEMLVDQEPVSSGDPSSYTVPGLFQVLAREIEMRRAAPAESPSAGAILRARFDETTGVPLRFLRVVPGSNRSSEWRLLEWRVPAGTSRPS